MFPAAERLINDTSSPPLGLRNTGYRSAVIAGSTPAEGGSVVDETQGLVSLRGALATWQSEAPMNQQFFVYILTNRLHTVLYTGVTNNLIRRVYEHREKLVRGFTSRYQVNKLVYYATSDDVRASIAREKQIKAGSRSRKLALIADMNPEWHDLYDGLT